MSRHNGATWIGTSLPLQCRIPEGFVVGASREVHDRLMTGMKDASMARPYRKVSEVEVAIRIPEGQQAKGMRLMRAEREISMREEDGYAVGTIPNLHIAEVVHLGLV